MTSFDANLTLPNIEPPQPGVRWFSPCGAVQNARGRVEVFVGGSLIASFDEKDRASRNATVVGLARDSHVHLGQLADAFDISAETLRQLRRQHDAEGIEGVIDRTAGRASKIDAPERQRIEAMFASGLSITKVHRRVRRRLDVGRSSIQRARKAWSAKPSAAPSVTASQPIEPEGSMGGVAAPAPAPVTGGSPRSLLNFG